MMYRTMSDIAATVSVGRTVSNRAASRKLVLDVLDMALLPEGILNGLAWCWGVHSLQVRADSKGN
jgi:hypothetical protein